MTKLTLKVEIEEWEGEPAHTITLESSEMVLVEHMEAMFLKLAHAMGFNYIAEVECKSYKSTEVKE